LLLYPEAPSHSPKPRRLCTHPLHTLTYLYTYPTQATAVVLIPLRSLIHRLRHSTNPYLQVVHPYQTR